MQKRQLTNDELQAISMPPVKEYLTAVQRDGTEMCSKEIFCQTMDWLKSQKCENIVSEQIVEQYAMSVARWIHIEQMISKYGYIAKHPTTGAPMQSPYVTMSQAYMKQIIACAERRYLDGWTASVDVWRRYK